MATDEEKDPFTSIDSSRRVFIKRMLAAGFAAPLIGSFSLDELAVAAGKRPRTFPQQHSPNQEHHHHHDHEDDRPRHEDND